MQIPLGPVYTLEEVESVFTADLSECHPNALESCRLLMLGNGCWDVCASPNLMLPLPLSFGFHCS